MAIICKMSKATDNLITLGDTLAEYHGISHWTLSQRLFGKGDFFQRLRGGADIRTGTAETALNLISAAWPENELAWPKDVQKPVYPPEYRRAARR